MKKVVLIIFGFVFSMNLYAQDSIVNYLDRKLEIVSVKNDAKYIEIKVKKDSIWKLKLYFRDGKLFKTGNSKSSVKNIFIGKFLSFHRNGKILRRLYFNQNGEKDGKSIAWFDNGKRDNSGSFKNDVQVGLWKYYYYSGELAVKLYFDSDGNFEKKIMYDKSGEEISDEYISYKEPIFRKGKEKFKNQFHKIYKKISFNIKTTIYVNFIIDVNGSIRDVWIVNNIPRRLKKEINKFVKSIKGWESAIQTNRKVPVNYSIALKFNG